MEHTHSYRPLAGSAREHRLLFLEKPATTPANTESIPVPSDQMDALKKAVDALGTKLQERAGTKERGGNDPESSVKAKMLDISNQFQEKSREVMDIMERNANLRAKGKVALESIMKKAEGEMALVEAEAKKIVQLREGDLMRQEQRYNVKREIILGPSSLPNERAVVYAESEASTTLAKIDALIQSIEKLLPLVSETDESLQLRDKLLIKQVDILSDLSKFQGARRDALKVVPNAPKTAVMDRIAAAEKHLGRATDAREKAQAILLTQNVSPETGDELNRRKDELYDSMISVFHDKTELAAEAHTSGAISLGDFEKALQEEITFLNKNNRSDTMDYELGTLVNEKAEKLVDTANAKVKEQERAAARSEARIFIGGTYGSRFINEGEVTRLFKKISDAEKKETSEKTNEEKKKNKEHFDEQINKANNLLSDPVSSNLDSFMKEVAAVLEQKNLGQYYGNSKNKETIKLVDQLVQKASKEMEDRITKVSSEVATLLRDTKKNEKIPENFTTVLESAADISRSLKVYDSSIRAFGKTTNPKYTSAMESCKRCFAEIIGSYVNEPAKKATNAAKNVATFKAAFEVVEEATKLMHDNRENIIELLGDRSAQISTNKALLEASLAAVIAKETNQAEKRGLLVLQNEEKEVIDPYFEVELEKKISETEKVESETEKQKTQNEETNILIVARQKIINKQTIENLKTNLDQLSKLDPKEKDRVPRQQVGTEIVVQNSIRYRCPTYAPSFRESTQNQLRSALQKTIPAMEGRKDKTSLSQEIIELRGKLQAELERWMTPNQNLAEARENWKAESSAIDGVINGLRGDLGPEELRERLGKALSFQQNLTNDQFSVQSRVSRIPADTTGQPELAGQVVKKYDELKNELAMGEMILQEVDVIKKGK